MRPTPIKSVAAVAFSLSLLLIPNVGRAAQNMLSTHVVGGNTGWLTAGVWKTNNGSGVPTGIGTNEVVAGKTYTLIQGNSGNPAIGNNLAETRTRNVYSNVAVVALWTFPGDSLELTT